MQNINISLNKVYIKETVCHIYKVRKSIIKSVITIYKTDLYIIKKRIKYLL